MSPSLLREHRAERGLFTHTQGVKGVQTLLKVGSSTERSPTVSTLPKAATRAGSPEQEPVLWLEPLADPNVGHCCELCQADPQGRVSAALELKPNAYSKCRY